MNEKQKKALYETLQKLSQALSYLGFSFIKLDDKPKPDDTPQSIVDRYFDNLSFKSPEENLTFPSFYRERALNALATFLSNLITNADFKTLQTLNCKVMTKFLNQLFFEEGMIEYLNKGVSGDVSFLKSIIAGIILFADNFFVSKFFKIVLIGKQERNNQERNYKKINTLIEDKKLANEILNAIFMVINKFKYAEAENCTIFSNLAEFAGLQCGLYISNTSSDFACGYASWPPPPLSEKILSKTICTENLGDQEKGDIMLLLKKIYFDLLHSRLKKETSFDEVEKSRPATKEVMDSFCKFVKNIAFNPFLEALGEGKINVSNENDWKREIELQNRLCIIINAYEELYKKCSSCCFYLKKSNIFNTQDFLEAVKEASKNFTNINGASNYSSESGLIIAGKFFCELMQQFNLVDDFNFLRNIFKILSEAMKLSSEIINQELIKLNPKTPLFKNILMATVLLGEEQFVNDFWKAGIASSVPAIPYANVAKDIVEDTLKLLAESNPAVSAAANCPNLFTPLTRLIQQEFRYEKKNVFVFQGFSSLSSDDFDKKITLLTSYLLKIMGKYHTKDRSTVQKFAMDLLTTIEKSLKGPNVLLPVKMLFTQQSSTLLTNIVGSDIAKGIAISMKLLADFPHACTSDVIDGLLTLAKKAAEEQVIIYDYLYLKDISSKQDDLMVKYKTSLVKCVPLKTEIFEYCNRLKEKENINGNDDLLRKLDELSTAMDSRKPLLSRELACNQAVDLSIFFARTPKRSGENPTFFTEEMPGFEL